jgi:hypothetical protein
VTIGPWDWTLGLRLCQNFVRIHQVDFSFQL